MGVHEAAHGLTVPNDVTFLVPWPLWGPADMHEYDALQKASLRTVSLLFTDANSEEDRDNTFQLPIAAPLNKDPR